MNRYVLNLNQQPSGDYEVHKEGCSVFPVLNFEELGNHMNCSSAIKEAEKNHPSKRIDGCTHCIPLCHNS